MCQWVGFYHTWFLHSQMLLSVYNGFLLWWQLVNATTPHSCCGDLVQVVYIVFRALIPVAFQSLLSRAVEKTEGTEVEPLEKLYALLAQCIYRHRNNYNKTELIQVRQPHWDWDWDWVKAVCFFCHLYTAVNRFICSSIQMLPFLLVFLSIFPILFHFCCFV